MEIAECSLNGLKTRCEKEKLLVTNNFSFSHSVFKRLVLQTLENQGLFGKGLIIYHTILLFNPLLDMPILGSFNSAANKDMMLEIWTIGDTVIWLSWKHCWKRRNCLLQAISPFPAVFSKAVCCWCIKTSIYGVKRTFENILEKEENARKQHFLLFLQCFLHVLTQFQIFHLHAFNLVQSKIWSFGRAITLYQMTKF